MADSPSRQSTFALTVDEVHAIVGAYFEGNPNALEAAEPIIGRMADWADGVEAGPEESRLHA